MAISFLAGATGAPGANGGATGAMDTTGAALLVLHVSWYAGTTADVTVSDTKGNTWLPLTKRSINTTRQRFWYVLMPVAGTGHTVTATGTGTFPALIVWAFTGVGSYQTESGNANTGAGVILSGSVTPSVNGALLLSGLASGDLATDVLTPGAWTQTTVPFTGSVNMQASVGRLVQPSAAAINPQWGSSSGLHADMAVSTAVFLPAVAVQQTAQPYVWGPV